MNSEQTIIKLAIGILVISVFAACSKTNLDSTPKFLVQEDSIGSWLMSDEINAFSSELEKNSLDVSSGLNKEDYLKVIDGQVRIMQKYQDDKGRIIDPVGKKEMYYTTPCYAHSVAILASSGYTQDKALIESGMKALDNSCVHLRNQFAPGNHGDFFTWPVLFAYRHFKEFADSARYQNWTESIAGIQPDKFYAYYRNYSMNWNLVHAAGEFLRFKEGFTDIHYIDTCMNKQVKHFTDEGMYNEWGNPLAYDLFARHYITGMLALGYKGKDFDSYRVKAQKGAWMSLFMQSLFGELPTGYRSSHHIWNEAEQSVVFEIYARQYKMAGQHKLAGAFKRGAMLSLQNIKSWIRPDGSGYVVKNKFPITKKHGYEKYSAHSTYNMLATSMLAQAYEFADADITEELAPCDIGGYIVDIHKEFHKVIASMDGTYMEYDTRGDQEYNPTGLLRVHIKGSHPQLGPSDGCAQKYSGDGVSIATGPSWKKNGVWHSLASQKPVQTNIQKLNEHAGNLSFLVTNLIVLEQDTVYTHETFTLKKGKLEVKLDIEGLVDSVMVTWPMLVNNGGEDSEIQMNKNSVRVSLENKQIQFSVTSPKNVSLKKEDAKFNHRNGIVQVAYYSGDSKSIKYSISEQ